MQQSLLAGEVATVTGAAQGNGRAIALGLAREGASVALADVNGAGAEVVAAEIVAAGGKAFGTALDVRDADACVGFAAAAEAALGGPCAILVNNAGIIRRVAIDDPDYDRHFLDTISVNLIGMKNVTRAFLAQLRRAKGRIVNLGSINSFATGPRATSYTASKGAVLQFTRALAAELAPEGIRVNGIAPGVIDTPMTEATRADPAAISRFMAHTPMGRTGQPEELVGPVLFLASAMSSYVTGAMLPVDGGYLTV